MRILPLIVLLVASPLATAADSHCTHSSPRQLDLALDGVKRLRIESGQHEVRLRAAPGSNHRLSGRACASKAGWLQDLTVTQQREGDTLVVRLRRENAGGLSTLVGENYAWIELAGSVPDDRLIQLVVGSGDASLEGAASASADVGSGDAELKHTRGAVTAKVGSGDLDILGAGALKVLAIGSGDIRAEDIRGKIEVGSIGSGDLKLSGGTEVTLGSIGSGSAQVRSASGKVTVGSLGSGDVEVDGAAQLEVGSIGSGDVQHRNITGSVQLPRKP